MFTWKLKYTKILHHTYLELDDYEYVVFSRKENNLFQNGDEVWLCKQYQSLWFCRYYDQSACCSVECKQSIFKVDIKRCRCSVMQWPLIHGFESLERIPSNTIFSREITKQIEFSTWMPYIMDNTSHIPHTLPEIPSKRKLFDTVDQS